MAYVSQIKMSLVWLHFEKMSVYIASVAVIKDYMSGSMPEIRYKLSKLWEARRLLYSTIVCMNIIIWIIF